MRYDGSLTKISQRVVSTLCIVLMSALPAAADSGESLINKGADNVAIEGYDTVAYFTEDRAVKGSKEYEFEWHDTRWWFSNVEHRNLFSTDPEKYAPQFGGLCAGAMRRGVEVKADPEAWTIVDGKLYMKVNKSFRDEWRQDITNNIKQANAAWVEKTGNK